MAPIDNVIAEIKLLEPGEHFSYRTVARCFNVLHATLTQRHKVSQSSQATKNFNQLALNPQQEAELVRYIQDLTKRAQPLTREMKQNLATHFNLNSRAKYKLYFNQLHLKIVQYEIQLYNTYK
jgi:uncharacterized coiled-coil DUF342 family protein